MVASEDVHTVQVRLVSTGIFWPALNQVVCALRFFYGVSLCHSEIPERIPYAREPRKLPVVLSADEVVRLFEARLDDPDKEYAMVDATIVKIHRLGAGAKRGLRATP